MNEAYLIDHEPRRIYTLMLGSRQLGLDDTEMTLSVLRLPMMRYFKTKIVSSD